MSRRAGPAGPRGPGDGGALKARCRTEHSGRGPYRPNFGHPWRPLPRWGAAAALLALGACARLPTPLATGPRGRPPARALGVLHEGWHTGLVFPVREITGPLQSLRPWFPQATWVAIGWGERPYYMARHPGWLTGLRALFPASSVLHVRTFLMGNTRNPPDIAWYRLRPRDWRRLRRFLDQSLATMPHGPLLPVAGQRRRGWFFASRMTYDALHTCNTWTVQALHAAGLPVHSIGVIFAGQIEIKGATLRRHSFP